MIPERFGKAPIMWSATFIAFSQKCGFTVKGRFKECRGQKKCHWVLHARGVIFWSSISEKKLASLSVVEVRASGFSEDLSLEFQFHWKRIRFSSKLTTKGRSQNKNDFNVAFHPIPTEQAENKYIYLPIPNNGQTCQSISLFISITQYIRPILIFHMWKHINYQYMHHRP